MTYLVDLVREWQAARKAAVMRDEWNRLAKAESALAAYDAGLANLTAKETADD